MQTNLSPDQVFESEVHAKIVSAGTFQNFQNQPSALAYLNGQIMLRKKMMTRIGNLEKKVSNFQKSGLTKRFLKVPSKLLPQDKVNCEQELSRASNVMLEFELLMKDLIVLKKSCWDETQTLKPKKKEEYEYYSDKVLEVTPLMDALEDIQIKLKETNLQVNKSNGIATKSVTILENKRIMRRRKENRKIALKKAFKRDVESLTIFLLKYTSKSFDEVFEVSEVKVVASKNQYSKKSKTDPSTLEGVNADNDLNVSGVEAGEGLEVDSIAEDDGSDAEEECQVIDQILDVRGFTSAGERDEVNNNNQSKKTKYKHEKLQRDIQVKCEASQLEEKDFKSLQFSKKDLKSLKLMLSLKVIVSSVEGVMKAFVDDWNEATTAVDDTVLDLTTTEGTEEMVEDNSKDNGKEKDDEERSKDNGAEKDLDSSKVFLDTEGQEKSMKKKYKRVIKLVIEEHGNNMKMRKLKKEVLKKVAEFDNRLDVDREESFDKFVVKVKNLIIEGKYVSLQ